MKFIGEVEIIKEYDDGRCEIVHRSKNNIAEGLGYGLANLFSGYGSTDLDDYKISYFQVGVGNLSANFPTTTNYINRSFYELDDALTAAELGGDGSIQEIVNLNQVVAEYGNFVSPINYTTKVNTFVGIDAKSRSIFSSKGFSTRLVLDKTMANSMPISEVGLFMSNPDGSPNNNRPILVAYKSFEPITKTSDFSFVILWRITVEDIGNNSLGFLGLNERRYYTFDMLSGVGDFNTTTDFPDRFEVGIPPTYDYQGAPLVVAFHGIGQSQNQWRLTGNVTVSNGWYDGLLSSLVLFDPPTIVKPTLYQDVLDRGWFYMAPHGRVGPPNSALDPDWQPYFGTPQDEVNPPLTGSSIYPHAKGTPNNWNNIIVFEQFKKILEYTVNHYPIDKTRIYFVGFSQGGGCALNFAAQLNDANPSAICPAAVASVGGTFNTWKLWEKYAASSIHSASPYWNTPGRDESNAPAGDVLIFWNNCSGNLDYLPVELTHGGAGSGVSANELSSFTPSDAPFIYNRTTTVGSNLVASTYVASTGMFNNLKHLPLYVMYSPEDSQGDIVTYASNLLAHELSSNNIHSNYKLQVSSADDIENMWIGLGMVSAAFDGLPVSSNIGYGPGKDASGDDVYKQVDIKTGTHHLGMVNQNDMLNFLSSATLNFPTEASTMVVGNDNYFYFRLKMSASFNQYSSSLLTSGLGVFNWKIDRPANTLWVSAINSLINTGAAINSPYFDPILADFNISNTNPLKIYNLSSTLYPSTENRILNISNIESIPSKIIYSRYVNGSLATSEILIKNGNNFRRPTVSGVICTYSSGQTTLTLNRLGYYEIYP